MQSSPFDELAYRYDGTLEGLLTAIFQSYAQKQSPNELLRSDSCQLRLTQTIIDIRTDMLLACRVKRGLIRKCGYSSFNAVRKASVSSDANAATYAYNFVRYAMDEHEGRLRPLSNIAHPAVGPISRICTSVNQECEKMRQFIRFQHLKNEGADFWFAKCSPRDSVVPLVMNHFVERFNIQPFMILDEAHDICGVYDGGTWYLVNTANTSFSIESLPGRSSEETLMQNAWRRFYKKVSVEARYNPELRRHFMPKRLWADLTEMQEEEDALVPANKH